MVQARHGVSARDRTDQSIRRGFWPIPHLVKLLSQPGTQRHLGSWSPNAYGAFEYELQRYKSQLSELTIWRQLINR